MSVIFNKMFSVVAFSHLIVDVMNGTRSVLLAFLSVPLGLTNATIGVVSTFYALAAAIAQPIFGWVTDRAGSRWVIAGGVLWMAFFFFLAIISPGTLALVFLVIASLGSGAFHPAGAVEATLVGRNQLAGREVEAASYFFFFGQTGFFLGPLLGGPLLDAMGQHGLLVLAGIALPVGLAASVQLRGGAARPAHEKPAGQTETRRKVEKLALLAIILVATCQSWAQQNITTFMPKYLSDLGQPAAIYGLLTSLFMFGSAFGNVIGGNLSERYGKVPILVGGLGLASIPLLLISQVGFSDWLYLLIPLAGFLNGSTFSIIMVLAQRIIPGGMGLASGLAMGLTYSSGAIGSSFSGVIADSAGIPVVFLLSAGLALLGALISPALRTPRPLAQQVSAEG